MNNKHNEFVYTKQYDIGRKVIFSFTENGKIIDLTGWSVIFSLKKPDGYIIVEDMPVDLENNQVEITLTDQMTVIDGILPFQLSLKNQERDLVSTVTSTMIVDKAPVQLDDVESQSHGSYVVGSTVTVEPVLTEGIEIADITVDGDVYNIYSPSLDGYQPLLTAGDNIDITDDTISATDTTYSAGTNISIDANNEISAVDTTYSAGTNISISANNEISAVDTTYSAGTNISIDANNEISATDTTYTAGDNISISNQNVISATRGNIISYGTTAPSEDGEDGDLYIMLDNNNKKIAEYLFMEDAWIQIDGEEEIEE